MNFKFNRTNNLSCATKLQFTLIGLHEGPRSIWLLLQIRRLELINLRLNLISSLLISFMTINNLLLKSMNDTDESFKVKVVFIGGQLHLYKAILHIFI